MRRWYLLATAAVTCAVALSALGAPVAAGAFQVTGGGGTQTQNPYGLWYAGAEACAMEGCHSAIAAKRTPHSDMVKDVNAFPSALVPAASSAFWPYSSPFGGLVLRPRDMYLQVGDGQGFLEYTGASGSALATKVVPADDIFVWSPMEYLFGEGGWDKPGTPVGYSSYSQSCSGCHNLGVTRPSNASYLLPNGAVQTTSTPSSVSALSIQCEVCHGTGKNPDGHKKGVPGVVGGKRMLSAQVCGQCHVNGETPQKNATKGAAFGNANGYTTDATLSAYLTPFTVVESEATFMTYVSSGGTKPKFLPNGANYSMRHSYYNEWLNNKVPSVYGGTKGHADPVNNAVRTYNEPKCLRCHSGLGFLNRIGATGPSGKRIVPTFPTVSEAAASDPGISCQVCHTGHVGYAAQGTGYDSMRRWANGRSVECGDCHNWQFEQLGQPLQYETIAGVEYARPSVNSVSRHAQREMFTGGAGGEEGTGGMWGVVPSGEFMPGTECKDCHMPRTHREGMPANDDGGTEATRQSHRFLVVAPGDAQAWKLRPAGDSCTPACHKGDAADFTRAEMQSWIDQKRSEVDRASNAASGALGAAAGDLGLSAWTGLLKAQPVTAAVPPATWAMLQHAAQNLDFVIGDGSKGIHNPEYALAGLRKSLLWAKSANVVIDASVPTWPASGAGMTVSGALHAADGSVIQGADVVLELSVDGGGVWTSVASAAADAGTGAFALPTGQVVGKALFRVSFFPSQGVSHHSAVMAVSVPVSSASLSPTTASGAWATTPILTATLGSTPGSLVFYSLSGATLRSPGVYTSPITIAAEGITTLTYWSANAQGVEMPTSVALRLDRSAPAVLSGAVAGYRDTATVKTWTSDRGSGVAKLEYALDGAALRRASSTWASVTTTKLGAHSLRARSTDVSGKVTSRTWVFRVRTLPRLTVSPHSGTYKVAKRKTLTIRGVLRTRSGKRVAGKAVRVQKSSDGIHWSHYTTRVSDASGAVSCAIKPTKRGTVYWRLYVPQSDSYASVSGGRLRIITR